MYHEITTKDRLHTRHRRLIVALLCVLLAVGIYFAVQQANANAREQGAVALRQSILSAAVRCCAIEGSYPLSLKHLEDHYGLRVNEKDYAVTYEAYATNMVPSVVVVPR